MTLEKQNNGKMDESTCNKVVAALFETPKKAVFTLFPLQIDAAQTYVN